MSKKKVFASILLILTSLPSIAQGSAPPPPMPPPPPGLPIDNAVYALLVIAIIYGVFRSFKLSKQN